jgi:hypothetical protein
MSDLRTETVAGDDLVGCSTVRPPEGEDAVATVIARVLPAYRGRGRDGALRKRPAHACWVLG